MKAETIIRAKLLNSDFTDEMEFGFLIRQGKFRQALNIFNTDKEAIDRAQKVVDNLEQQLNEMKKAFQAFIDYVKKDETRK